jgi:UDP-N-acetylmuramate dehydrogenase
VTISIRDGVPLAPLTSLELGGDAAHLVDAANEAAVVEALRWAEARGLPSVVLGGGSNVVIADAGFPGLVLRVVARGRRFAAAARDTLVTAAAGEPWDDLVADAVGRGLAGIECLSGIPGWVGAAPIQNVGAYGQEVADTIRAVRVVERGSWRVHELTVDACDFGYRDSVFKRQPDRFVVMSVTFALRAAAARTPRYRELEEALPRAEAPSLADVRGTVLTLRRKKSMLIADGDPNRRSVGSFFLNPVVTASVADAVVARAGADIPRWAAPGGMVKLSAGWLIEHAGFAKGTRRGAVGISSAHALALVHHGGGSSAQLVALAQAVRNAVQARFGVELIPEARPIGLVWNPEP